MPAGMHVVPAPNLVSRMGMSFCMYTHSRLPKVSVRDLPRTPSFRSSLKFVDCLKVSYPKGMHSIS